MLGGCENQRGPRTLQKMITEWDAFLLPLRSRGRGPSVGLKPAWVTGCGPRSPAGAAPLPPGSKAGWPRPPLPLHSSASTAPRSKHPSGPGRPAHPPPRAPRARALDPAYFLGVHGQELSPLGSTRVEELCGEAEGGRTGQNRYPPTAADLLSHRLSHSQHRCRPAPPGPRPARVRARPRRAAVARVKGRPAEGRGRGAPRACVLLPDRIGPEV